MSDKIELHKRKVPSIQELYDNEQLDLMVNVDNFNAILSSPPPASWVKVHPYIAGYKYLPVEKTEWLLRRIFKQYKIEITGQGVAFNGVWVTVRVHYFHPIIKEWMFHDGIGSTALQVKKGSSPSDLANINNGALSMAFPLAKTLAIKDSCDAFGDAFGANLNRKDIMPFTADEKLKDIQHEKEVERFKKVINEAESKEFLESQRIHLEDFEECREDFEAKMKTFK